MIENSFKPKKGFVNLPNSQPRHNIDLLKRVFNFILNKLNELEIHVCTEKKYWLLDAKEELVNVSENHIFCVMKKYIENEMPECDMHTFRKCFRIGLNKSVEACKKKYDEENK